MSQAVKQQSLPPYDPVHLLAQVQAIHVDGSYEVNSDGFIWYCQRAASCLLMPQLHDTVLISGPNAEQVYLIAVITQANPQHTSIHIQGELQLQAGQLNLQGQETLNLHSQSTVKLHSQDAIVMQSEQLQLATEQAQCLVGEMDYVGKQVRSQVGLVRLLGQVYESIVDRLSFMSKSSYKVTETIDHTRAGTVDVQAEQSARVHAKYTMVTAKDVVKVDGKHIHMG